MTSGARQPLLTLAELRDAVAGEVAKVVVGQDAALGVLLAALSVGGHVLLEGVPGVGKTLLADATAGLWAWTSAGCSSCPTCCPPTSPAP